MKLVAGFQRSFPRMGFQISVGDLVNALVYQRRVIAAGRGLAVLFSPPGVSD